MALSTTGLFGLNVVYMGVDLTSSGVIYYLQAENDEQAESWISGAGKCIKAINQNNENNHSLQEIDGRISELENQNAKLKNVLEYVAKQFNTIVDHIVHSFEAGEPFKTSSSASEEKKEPVMHNIEIVEALGFRIDVN